MTLVTLSLSAACPAPEVSFHPRTRERMNGTLKRIPRGTARFKHLTEPMISLKSPEISLLTSVSTRWYRHATRTQYVENNRVTAYIPFHTCFLP